MFIVVCCRCLRDGLRDGNVGGGGLRVGGGLRDGGGGGLGDSGSQVGDRTWLRS